MARRLTDRQLAVLAAIERLGKPTIPELAAQFPSLEISTIWAVVQALEKHGKVTITGNRLWPYLGDPSEVPSDIDVPRIRADEVVRVSSGRA